MANGLVAAVVSNACVYIPNGPGRCENTVVIEGVDGVRYTYCHLSLVTVAAGDSVAAGDVIGFSGSQPGTPGAGNTTGLDLHVSVRVDGQSVCPQPMLLGIIRQTPIPPTAAPTSGCITGQAGTNWSVWLAQATSNSRGG